MLGIDMVPKCLQDIQGMIMIIYQVGEGVTVSLLMLWGKFTAQN